MGWPATPTATTSADTYEDEFIELYNTGAAAVDISGWRLGDSSALNNFFQFPTNTVIAPGSYVVLFGGGTPTGFTGPVYTDDGAIGSNGLIGTGEDVHLIDDTGDTVAVISHTPWPSDQSLVRHPPDGDDLVPHKTVSTIKGPVLTRQQPTSSPNPTIPSSSAKCSPIRLPTPMATPIATASATRTKTNSSNCTTPAQNPFPWKDGSWAIADR